MTLDDLENFYVKRSYVRKDTRYVYAFHHPTSLHLVSHAAAFDHYDALMCVGPHQVRRGPRPARRRPASRPASSPRAATTSSTASAPTTSPRDHAAGRRPTVLIAPSWQEDNILDLCADEAIRPLLGRGWRVVVRPHPEYTKRYRTRWEQLQARFADVPAEDLYFEQDFSSSDSILDADVLVTDWSSVFCEFALVAFKPCVFVDSPMKETTPSGGTSASSPRTLGCATARASRSRRGSSPRGFPAWWRT